MVPPSRCPDARRSRGPDRGAASRLQLGALVLGYLQRAQPARRGGTAVPAPGAARRRLELSGAADLRPSPFPLGPRAGRARAGALEPGPAPVSIPIGTVIS